MTVSITRSMVEEAIVQPKATDRQARISELEKQLAKVHKDIAEQERLERRWALVQSAYEKLRQELGKSLTREERDAIDGIYLFLHSGMVDMVRTIPSNTDRGENKALEKDLQTVEALQELAELKS